MGCDIHCFKEKKKNGVWVTADVWEDKYADGKSVPYETRFTGRNYQLFGVLAGVRKETSVTVEARGMPADACSEVKHAAESWGCDGHTHSWLTLAELKLLALYVKTGSILQGLGQQPVIGEAGTALAPIGPQLTGSVVSPISGMMAATQWEKLRESIESGAPDWDLLYPYCASTNSPDYVRFSVQVPLDYTVGEDLQRIISGFEEVDGEDQRLVFFFDN